MRCADTGTTIERYRSRRKNSWNTFEMAADHQLKALEHLIAILDRAEREVGM